MLANKIITAAAILFFIVGTVSSFAPEIITNLLKMEQTNTTLLLVQVIGAFNFSMAIQNWLVKSSTIGGIYNRPIVMANLTYFIMSGLAITKQIIALKQNSPIVEIFGVIFLLFTIAFLFIFFNDSNLKPSK